MNTKQLKEVNARIKKMVVEVRDKLKAERALLSKEARAELPPIGDVLRGALLPLCQDEIEKTKTLFWIHKYTVGSTAKNNPDSNVIAVRYRAYPLNGVVPDWVAESFRRQRWYWNVLAFRVETALKTVGAQYTSIKEAQEHKLISEEEALDRIKQVDYSEVRAATTAQHRLSKSANDIRKNKNNAKYILGESLFDYRLAEYVAKMRSWEQTLIDQKFTTCIKNRFGKALGYDEGYPKTNPEWNTEEGGIDLYFNGSNFDFPALGSKPASFRNSYVNISESYNPEDHSGPRAGKYRTNREIRLVTIRDGKKEFLLNVLFHDVPTNARMKGLKVRAEKIGTKIEWHFIPTYEVPPSVPAIVSDRVFAGFDPGWRKDGDDAHDAHIIGHTWTETSGHKVLTFSWDSNRWATRFSKRNPDFPIVATPDGLDDFKSRVGKLQRDMKAKMTEALSENKPVGWERYGKRGINKLMEEVRKSQTSPLNKGDCMPRFPNPLVALLPEYDAWEARDKELCAVYSRLSRMVTERKDKEYFRIARQICVGLIADGVTDLGIENTDVKELAEKPTEEGKKNWELHITNVQQKSRQRTGPAIFRGVLSYVAGKLGIRIHLIPAPNTTKTCSYCGYVNKEIGMRTEYDCPGCGRHLIRDANAARNMAHKAEECAVADKGSRVCTRKKEVKLKEKVAKRSKNLNRKESNIQKLVAVTV
jgi:predicted RNA-binding Zn-ribbon protein involved in translation (DUF1610 family)